MRKGREKIYLTKEFPVYDDDFILRGYIQMFLQNIELNTMNPFLYNEKLYRNIDARSNRGNLKKKKKVYAQKINLNNYKNIVNLSKTDSTNNDALSFAFSISQ